MHTMKLEIQYLSGDTEVRPLDPGQSISIGSAGSCEVQIDEEDVAPLHCRLSWNGSAWQLKAANLDGVTAVGLQLLSLSKEGPQNPHWTCFDRGQI